MASSHPSLGEIRCVFRLLGECTELGADPIAWREHLAVGCSALFANHFVSFVESDVTDSPVGTPALREPDYFNGFDGGRMRHDAVSRFMQSPTEISPIVRTMLRKRKPSLTCLRQQLVNDREWYRTVFFQEYLRPIGLHDQVTSVEVDSPQSVSVIVLHSYGNHKCTARTARVLDVLHRELSRLRRAGKLVPRGGFSLRDLSRRQQAILWRLFQGDSEKQLARQLGISRHTAHDYIKMLYRRFGVRSRGELINRCLKFWPALQHSYKDLEGPQGGAGD